MAEAAAGGSCPPPPPPPPPNNNNNNNKPPGRQSRQARRSNRRLRYRPDVGIDSEPEEPQTQASGSSESESELQGAAAAADPLFYVDEESLQYLPEKFDGNPDAVTPFIAQCQIFMEKSTRDFSVDRNRVCFVTSMLLGRAARWATAKLERCGYLMNNYRAFMMELKHVFEDPQRREAAKRKIRRLRQGMGTVGEYAGAFESIAQDLDWNESSLVDQFLEGLNTDIHSELTRRTEVPTNLNDLIRLCLHIERRLARAAAEAANKPRADPPRALVAPQSHQADPTEPVGGARMRLTQEEKERRRKLNLCLYCGSGGHYADNCPAKGSKNSPSGNSPAPL
ncbi:retrotransposon-derived protein PEG10 isoform 2 [Mesocricetus auratus]|uniref:Retrotransposon-derived protein PEG10 isoform 2 n=1 Tax=Mesocricetus auratus TaxID=10036 RepID=A0A1U7Q9C9_MESAU|nr:retrotransposon-derived protein PEG10 isoform 2 [Mesocricetus auratus]